MAANEKCPRCDVPMRPGVAILPTVVGEEDDIGGCVTLSYGGPGRLIDCLKCPECGHSITGKTSSHPPR